MAHVFDDLKQHAFTPVQPDTLAKQKTSGSVDTPIQQWSNAPSSRNSGWLAQLVERLPYKQNVGGSIPSPPTSFTKTTAEW